MKGGVRDRAKGKGCGDEPFGASCRSNSHRIASGRRRLGFPSIARGERDVEFERSKASSWFGAGNGKPRVNGIYRRRAAESFELLRVTWNESTKSSPGPRR